MNDVDLFRWLAATFIVALLLGGFSVLVKQLQERKMLPLKPGNKRISIQETTHIDRKTKLVLAVCDKTDYLLLITGDNAQVVDKLTPKKPTKRA